MAQRLGITKAKATNGPRFSKPKYKEPKPNITN